MILCLDAGNSRLKYGLRSDDRWLAQGAIDYDAVDALLRTLPAVPERILACNVAGTAARESIEGLAATADVTLEWFASAATSCGVRNGYDRFAQLGADRWAALIGARSLHPGACVVVMAGTATTIDVLDHTGLFRGGLILPGLHLMQSALARNTADLPHARGSFRELPATNTDDAIVSGALHATLGAVTRMRSTLGNVATCLLSGGAAPALAPCIEAPLKQVENLVLEGLARFAAVGAGIAVPVAPLPQR